jgi:hypothetical protein
MLDGRPSENRDHRSSVAITDAGGLEKTASRTRRPPIADGLSLNGLLVTDPLRHGSLL